MNEKDLNLLYRSLDERLNSAEQQQLKAALQSSNELRLEKARLISMRKLIAVTSRKNFEPFFADRVMRRLNQLNDEKNRQQQIFDSLLSVFRPIAIGAAIVLIAMLSYNILTTDQISLSGALATPEITLEAAIDPTLSLALELDK